MIENEKIKIYSFDFKTKEYLNKEHVEIKKIAKDEILKSKHDII
jgi:hypothetical protein